MKSYILFALALGLGCFGLSQPAKAEILQLPLHQGNTPIAFSQGVSASLLSSDTNDVYMETRIEGTELRINIFPLESQTSVRLVVSDKNLQASNPSLLTGALTTREHRLAFSLIPKPSETAKADTAVVIATSTPPLAKPTESAIVPTALKKYRTTDELVLSAAVPVGTVHADSNLRLYDNDGLSQISKAYDISNPQKLSLVGVLRYTYNGIGSQAAYQFDPQTLNWQPLPSYNDVKNDLIYFSTDSTDVTVAVFNTTATADGIASWYDQSRYKSFKYQGGNFAANRDYPKGTKLKVTRLKTGASIIVTVNDYGPELKTQRLIDLDKKAFQQLASTGAGEIYVTIEKIDG